MPLSPEDRANLEALSKVQTTICRQKAEVLCRGALMGMEVGAGCTMMLVTRSELFPELASFVVVSTGKYAESDLANIREFVLASAQDATVGMETKNEASDFGKKGGMPDGS